jgi:hypothetical protein
LYSLPRQEQQKEREREREGGRDREAGTGKRGERDGEKETQWWQTYGEGLRLPNHEHLFCPILRSQILDAPQKTP